MPGKTEPLLRTSRVSVVIPAHNRAQLLTETLDSVAQQSYSNVECIVVDDGSTDETGDVAEAYCERDGRFRVRRQPNLGKSAARNHGLRDATGEFVLFLDSDDLLAPDAIERLKGRIDQVDAAVLAWGETFVFKDSDVKDGSIFREHREERPEGHVFQDLFNGNYWYSPLLRRSTIVEAGGWDPQFDSAEDWDMWLTMAKEGRVVHVPEVTIYHRDHEGSYVRRNLLDNFRSARRVVKKHTRSLPPKERRRLRRKGRSYLRGAYLTRLRAATFDLQRQMKWGEARPVFREIVRLQPNQLLDARIMANTLWAILVPASIPPPWWTIRDDTV